ncbi:DUF5684 domain-containing protein [Labilibacter marinus]|uniref:DUF5684 domain-containing protein n=1 Tax=Labilibacter marinus TaxID=1477105 RepID=UPI00094F88F8|nr:DUF5684 domain-containing protein [Labilibacter marinus]
MEEFDQSAGMFAAVGTGAIIFSLLIAVFFIIVGWKIYEKAGKPGWAVIIPIYREIVLLEIIKKPMWWIIMLFIPPFSIIFGIWSVNLLSKSFGKGVGFTIGLLFFPYIFGPILAFGSAKYEG